MHYDSSFDQNDRATDSEIVFDPIFAPGVYDLVIGERVFSLENPSSLPSYLTVLDHIIIETQNAKAIADRAITDRLDDDFMCIAGSHATEGLVAMGVKGDFLHIAHIVDKS